MELFTDSSIFKKIFFREADSISWLLVLLAEFLGVCFLCIVWNLGLRACLGRDHPPISLSSVYLCSCLSV